MAEPASWERAFEQEGDGLVVKAVDAGGPAWEAGLAAGDEVVQFAVGTDWIEGGPAAWQKRLDDAEPGVPNQPSTWFATAKTSPRAGRNPW